MNFENKLNAANYVTVWNEVVVNKKFIMNLISPLMYGREP